MSSKQFKRLLELQRRALQEIPSRQFEKCLREFIEVLDKCSPWQLVQFDQVVRNVHREHEFPHLAHPALVDFTANSFAKYATKQRRNYRLEANDALRRYPAAAQLFCTSHNGFIREEAVKLLETNSKASKVLLLIRCNDWGGPVQSVALRKLRANVGHWSPSDTSELVFFVLSKRKDWGRGGALAALEVMSRPNWKVALRQALIKEKNGPLARELRNLLKSPAIDKMLVELSGSAACFQVRLVAAQTILEGRARWFTGKEWQWLDKSMGRRRRVSTYDERHVSFSDEIIAKVLSKSANDNCAAIRKIAADHLIRNGPSIETREHELSLRADKNVAVRARIAFFERKWCPTGEAD